MATAPAVRSHAPRRPSLTRLRVRWTLAVVAFLAMLMLSPWSVQGIWWVYNSINDIPKIDEYKWTESSQEAINARIELSTSLFQTTIALVAGIWGLALVKKEEATVAVHAWPERFLVLNATLTLLWSAISYVSFVQDMSQLSLQAARDGSLPDITHREVAANFVTQCLSLIVGLLMVGLTVASGLWIQEKDAP